MKRGDAVVSRYCASSGQRRRQAERMCHAVLEANEQVVVTYCRRRFGRAHTEHAERWRKPCPTCARKMEEEAGCSTS